MKTERELNALKEEVEALNRKLAELTEEELEQVTGGAMITNQNMAAINTQKKYNKLYGKTGTVHNEPLNDVPDDHDNNAGIPVQSDRCRSPLIPDMRHQSVK